MPTYEDVAAFHVLLAGSLRGGTAAEHDEIVAGVDGSPEHMLCLLRSRGIVYLARANIGEVDAWLRRETIDAFFRVNFPFMVFE
jgi:hypothetical protein